MNVMNATMRMPVTIRRTSENRYEVFMGGRCVGVGTITTLSQNARLPWATLHAAASMGMTVDIDAYYAEEKAHDNDAEFDFSIEPVDTC